MINLLSHETKNELRAARSNSTLLKYLFIVIMGVVFLLFISVGVYFILMDIKGSAEKSLSINQQQGSSYSAAEEQAKALKASLAKAKSILDNEIRYSKLLTSISAAMPEGTVIDSLSLNSKIFESSVTLTIYAVSTDAALKLKEKFQSSSLFTGVTFQSITNSNTTKSEGYPVTASVSLSINKGSLK